MGFQGPRIQKLPLIGCVTGGKWLTLSDPHFFLSFNEELKLASTQGDGSTMV